MSIVKTEALLLKKINFSDSSNIIHFYTKEFGKISVIAKGSRQIKSQFRGYIEPLNHLSIIFYNKSTRDIQTLSKVDLIHTYISNLNDIIANSYGMAILESIDKLVHHNEENQKLFDMTINILDFIDQKPGMADIAFLLFLLGAIKLLGYKINFDHCHYCGEELSNLYYNDENPQPVCFHCAGKYFDEIQVNQVNWIRKADMMDLLLPIKTIEKAPESAKTIDFLLNYAGMHFDFYPKLNSLELLKYLK